MNTKGGTFANGTPIIKVLNSMMHPARRSSPSAMPISVKVSYDSPYEVRGDPRRLALLRLHFPYQSVCLLTLKFKMSRANRSATTLLVHF
jgi:hypothetical protein